MRLMEIDLPAVVHREGKIFVAICPDNYVTSQGKSVEEALKNLKEALELYFEDPDASPPMSQASPLLTTVKVELHESVAATVGA